ncbi:hypothetical protein BG004_002235 [Podila humilis]|nr:hypothetical protein BG004_002235 [Podila humilis]
MERPVVMPISTTEARSSHAYPDYGFGKRYSATLTSLPFITVSDTEGDSNTSETLELPGEAISSSLSPTVHSLSASLSDMSLRSSGSSDVVSSFTHEFDQQGDNAMTSTPMLPSQLRKRHESLKLQPKQANRSHQQQQHPSPSFPSSSQSYSFSTSKHYDDNYNSDDESEAEGKPPNRYQAPVTQFSAGVSLAPQQPTHSLGRAKSYSQFETNRKSLGYSPLPDSISPSLASMYHPTPASFASSSSDSYSIISPSIFTSGHMQGRHNEMPTRDWVKMQCRINELEQQIVHVSRANQLLNQELDKVNGHLLRLTSGDDDSSNASIDGWRREYEFLVQQVDLMHRQLQMAQSPQYQYQLPLQHQQELQQQQQQGSLPMIAAPGTTAVTATMMKNQNQDTSLVSEQLHSEVKELAYSLRSWQAAFRDAEEKYRRKCDGERALKQTLQERETQLSGLVSKLSRYESDFQKSIASYTQQVDKLLEQQHPIQQECKITETNVKNVDEKKMDHESLEDLSIMPGTFPSTTGHPEHTGDHLSVSIFSWAALLATYMLS